MAFIELAQPRTIAIDDRGKTFTLKLTRISKKLWLRYFDGIVSTSENQGGKRVNRYDAGAAALDLVESALMDATGYKTVDGGAVNALPGWQQKLPLAHRLAAGEALVNVERDADIAGGDFFMGAEAVYLKAVWGANERGEMQRFKGLCHKFSTPTAEQHHRFSRDSSRSVIVGGSRKGVTRWLGVQPALVDLYDELIVSVEGYAVDGVELGDDRDAIVSEMDTYHKVAAADKLFGGAEANITEEE